MEGFSNDTQVRARACNMMHALVIRCAVIRSKPQAFCLCHSFGDLRWEWDASLLVHSGLWCPPTCYIKPTSILEIGEVTNLPINYSTQMRSGGKENKKSGGGSDLSVARNRKGHTLRWFVVHYNSTTVAQLNGRAFSFVRLHNPDRKATKPNRSCLGASKSSGLCCHLSENCTPLELSLMALFSENTWARGILLSLVPSWVALLLSHLYRTGIYWLSKH